eukprot:1698235-Rhodomonas_salina.1
MHALSALCVLAIDFELDPALPPHPSILAFWMLCLLTAGNCHAAGGVDEREGRAQIGDAARLGAHGVCKEAHVSVTQRVTFEEQKQGK